MLLNRAQTTLALEALDRLVIGGKLCRQAEVVLKYLRNTKHLGTMRRKLDGISDQLIEMRWVSSQSGSQSGIFS